MLVNGRIHVLDDRNAVAREIAVRGNRVVAVGDAALGCSVQIAANGWVRLARPRRNRWKRLHLDYVVTGVNPFHEGALRRDAVLG